MKQHLLIEGCDIHVILNLFIQKRGRKYMAGYPTDDGNKLFEEKFVLNHKALSGGKSSILKNIPAAIKTPDIENLAIICDADSQPVQAVWQAISERLKGARYQNLPQSLSPEGTIIEKEPELPKIGIWIFPNNRDEGAVEDFFQQLFDENDTLFNHAKSTVDQLVASNHHRFAKKDGQKAIVSTWLAWQEQPGRSMGIALQNKWVDAKKPIADQFVDWFERVFEVQDQ